MIENICAVINISKLDKAIENFERDNPDYCKKNGYNYLIMSTDTCKSLAKIFGIEYDFRRTDKVSMYQGNKIAIDNSIPFGSVEIR